MEIQAAHLQRLVPAHEVEDLLVLADQADAQTLVIALISGGGSAILPMPLEYTDGGRPQQLALADKQAVTRELLACGADACCALPSSLREVLLTVGRMKYLRPLYGAMGRHARTRALARSVFACASPRYHALSRRVAASVLERHAGPPSC